MSEAKRADRPPSWVVAFGLVGLVALGAAYWELSRPGRALLWHSQIGDALAPVASFLSLFAVIAALWAVHVQRIELREQREEMKAQRQEFERTARAQEQLAASQAQLAEAQTQANVLTLRSEHARRSATLATLRAALQASELESFQFMLALDRAHSEGRMGTLVKVAPIQMEPMRELVAAEEKHLSALEGRLGFDRVDASNATP